MFLSKLEIFGFKSFANKTNISFNRGITGIVGPNGCGKTNIVDAIRWVLGEQKTATLRSDKMENVIFNGTREKKPMGMSEVSLTLENDRGVLPTDYTSVTITRRIFRSGESEYLLNKNICRLKDITNLFMDTGIGANAYSVIELKMVETILSSRTEERRKLFEEAAGVNKYKLRRRLSLKKLEDVKADLTRVNDIVSEVEKTVRSLERQAKRADQYSQIQSVLREKELDLAEREYSMLNQKLQLLNDSITEQNLKKDQIDIDIRKLETELIEYRVKINSIDANLQSKRKEISENSEELYAVQKNISVSEERLKSLQNNQERLVSEIAELESTYDSTLDEIEENRQSLTRSKSQTEEKDAEIISFENISSDKRGVFESKKEILKTLNQNRFNLLKLIADKENLLSNLKKDLASYNSNITKLNDKIQNVTNKIAKTVGFIEELSVEKEAAEKKLNEAGLHITLRQSEKEKLEKELNELRIQEVDEKTLSATIKEKINFLQQLLNNLEGISKGAKVLIEQSSTTGNKSSIFADIGTAKEDFRFALEAALKSVLNNLLVDSFDNLNSAVKYLKENDLGKASFYLLQENKKSKSLIDFINNYSLKKKSKSLSRENSFVGWSSNFVETESNWLPYFKQVLNNIAVIKDLSSAIELHKKYPEFSFTTLEGDIVHGSGIIEAGSLPKQDETLFGRRQLLQNLFNELPKHEASLAKLQASIQHTEESIASIDLKNLSDQEKLIANDLSNIEKQISQLEFEKKKADEEIEIARKDIQEYVDKANLLHSHLETTEGEMSDLNKQRIEMDESLASFEAELKESESELNSSLEQFNSAKLELERLRGQITNIESSIGQLESNVSSILNGIEKRKKDSLENKNETDLLATVIEESKADFEEINGLRNSLLEQETSISLNLKSVKDEASQLESQLNALRNERQIVSDRVHGFDIKANEYKMRIENLIGHIKENYSIELEIKVYDDLETFNFEEVSTEVQHLKEKIRSIGPVNLLAYSEYEEEKTRLDFLHKQRNDLTESEKDLVKTINEINETAQNLFLETFTAIRSNFVDIFQSLFNPGDEADLTLEEGVDPLEGKIDIIAKPKGKRPTGIELLSGGEKTLTATALLFAIYLVKPSPFCILDEVDAPLDDANIDRFTRLIQKFTDKTQFIIVTHNKRTMEAAETMYGVTMQEEGISKLVGVRFEEIPVSYEAAS